MKKKLFTLLSLTIMASLGLYQSCDEVDFDKLGREAAYEFCDCMDFGNSLKDCEKELKKNYSNLQYTDKKFMKAFNEVGEMCGVYIERW